MKIKTIKIENIRNIKHLEIKGLPDFGVFVGPNAIGKSTILEGIASCFSAYSNMKYVLKGAVRATETRGVIDLEIEPNEHEVKGFLELHQGANEEIARNNFVISTWFERGTSGKNATPTGVAKLIISNLDKEEAGKGIGTYFLISPHRELPEGLIAGVSLAAENERISQERRNDQKKRLGYLKQKIINIFTEYKLKGRSAGEKYFELYENLNNLLSPKKLLEPNIAGSGSYFALDVEGPMGIHSIDLLSSGEKEILMLLSDIIFFKRDNSIICIDEPDLHLESRLQKNLFELLKSLPGNNQILLSTHSREIIEYVPLNNIISLSDPNNDGNIIGKVLGEKEELKAIYSALGLSHYSQAISSVSILVEGEFDNYIWELITTKLGTVEIRKTGNVNLSLGLAGTLPVILEDTLGGTSVWVICDRDFLSDEEIQTLGRKYDKLIVLGRRMIENYLLDPYIFSEALKTVNIARGFDPNDKSALRDILKTIADDQKALVLRDWFAYEVNNWLARSSEPKVKEKALRENAKEYLSSLLSDFGEVFSEGNFESKLSEKTALLGKIEENGLSYWDNEGWLIYSSGKNIIGAFIQKHTNGTMRKYALKHLLASTAVRTDSLPGDIKLIEDKIFHYK